MPLIDLWKSVKAEFGDGLPHELKGLKLSLPEGLVTLHVRYDKGRLVDQSVEITFADSGKVGSVMGRVREEFWVTATRPFFLLSPEYERFYFTRDKEGMKDYLAAKLKHRTELENLRDAFERGQRDAADTLRRAESELAKLDRLREAHDDWEKAGFWDDKKLELHNEETDKQLKIIRESQAVLRETAPTKTDSSYVVAVRTSTPTYLNLERIVSAVNAKKKELLDNLGVLPKTKTEIALGDVMSLVVDWK